MLGDRATETTLRGIAERSHDAARAQGFAAGWAEGQRASLARSATARDEQAIRFDEESRRVLAEQQAAARALAAAVRQCEELAVALRDQLVDGSVELALQIAEAVLGRELEVAVDPGADAVRRAVTTTPVDVPLVVRLHPDDLAALDASVLGDRPAHGRRRTPGCPAATPSSRPRTAGSTPTSPARWPGSARCWPR